MDVQRGGVLNHGFHEWARMVSEVGDDRTYEEMGGMGFGGRWLSWESGSHVRVRRVGGERTVEAFRERQWRGCMRGL